MDIFIALIIIVLKLIRSCYSRYRIFSFSITSKQPDPIEETTTLCKLDAIAS